MTGQPGRAGGGQGASAACQHTFENVYVGSGQRRPPSAGVFSQTVVPRALPERPTFLLKRVPPRRSQGSHGPRLKPFTVHLRMRRGFGGQRAAAGCT